jgi:hypothetical protein
MLVNFFATAQKVKVMKMNRDYFRHSNVEGFHCLHDDMNAEAYEWIGDIRINFDTIKPSTLKKMFNKLGAKANRLSANAFRVINSDVYTFTDEKYIDLGIYYLKWEDRDENLKHFQNAKVYLFGFLGHHRRIDGYTVAVNGEKMILEELRYKLYEPEVDEVMKIKLGKGFKSDQVKVKIEKDMLPRYYTFNVYKGIFSQGVISEHEWSFGELLVRILRKERVHL